MVVSTTGGVDIGAYTDNRALIVPFDNDAFVSYNAAVMNSSGTGHEAAAFYDNTSRNGLVVGSVTHDTWKTGIFFSGSNNKLNTLEVFGGQASLPSDNLNESAGKYAGRDDGFVTDHVCGLWHRLADGDGVVCESRT